MSENAPVRKSRIDDLMSMCPDVKDVNELMDIMVAAKEAYVNGKAAGPKELSTLFPKLPYEVCQKMVSVYGWRSTRIERLEDLRVAAAVDFADYVRDARRKVAKDLVDQLSPVVKLLSDEIGNSLGDADSKYRTMDARRLAEAVAQIADKLMKAAGIDGTAPALPESALPDGKSRGKQPWMTINAAGPVTIAQGDDKKDLSRQGAGDENQQENDDE